MLKVANSVISATRITGTLPVANGGTGVTTSTGTGNTVLSAAPTLSGDVNLSTGNLVIGTAGKGIDFSVTSEGSGTMTSELLADYEEGTWTPSVSAGAITGTGITYTGTYTKIGRAVYINLQIKSTANDLRVLSYVVFSGVPFTVFNASSGVVTSEDVDLFVSNGFVGVGGTAMILSACGSVASTNTLNVTVTAYVP